MEILVFKTSVHDPMVVDALKPKLDRLAGKNQWNFDLEDCDKILRIASGIEPEAAVQLMKQLGFQCAELEG